MHYIHSLDVPAKRYISEQLQHVLLYGCKVTDTYQVSIVIQKQLRQ